MDRARTPATRGTVLAALAAERPALAVVAGRERLAAYETDAGIPRF